MTQKNFAGVSLGAVLLAGMGVLAVCAMLFVLRMSHIKTDDRPITAAKTGIHGQVIYDQRAALPPQATLLVQLSARDLTNNTQKIVAEARYKITEHTPLDFTLPVTTAELDRNFSYILQAKISVGDALWFVNETAMPVEPERAGYLIRLTMVERGNSEMTGKNQIRGKEWLAEDILGKGIIDKAHVTLFIDSTAKTDPTGAAMRYSVSGSGGCNRYFTTVTLNENNDTLKFEPLGMTFMACAEAISGQEAQFIDMMSKVRAYRINQVGFLYLLDENHNSLSRFAPAD